MQKTFNVYNVIQTQIQSILKQEIERDLFVNAHYKCNDAADVIINNRILKLEHKI